MTKSRVQHIMRLAVQDWRTSKVRARSFRAADPLLRLVYLEALIALYEFGGSMPSDPEELADILLLPADDIARCLPILETIGKSGRGGFVIEGGVLTNQRVSEDLDHDRKFREKQANLGRKGGLAKASLSERQAGEDGPLSPPEPSPEPEPSPSPNPEPSPTPSPAPEPARQPATADQQRKPTEQQAKVQLVFDVFDRHGSERPKGGVVATWIGIFNGDVGRLCRELTDLAGAGKLDEGAPYLFSALKGRARNAAPAQRPRLVPAPAAAANPARRVTRLESEEPKP